MIYRDKKILLTTTMTHAGGYDSFKFQVENCLNLFGSVNVLFTTLGCKTYLNLPGVTEFNYRLLNLSKSFFLPLHTRKMRNIISNTINQTNPDIIITYSTIMNYCVTDAAREFGIPVLSFIIGNNHYRAKTVATHYIQKGVKNSWGIAFVSEPLMNDFLKYHNTSHKRTFIVHEAIDINYFYPRTESKDKKEFTVLTAGRLEKGKRFDIAIEAFSRILSQVPNSKLLIAGKGTMEQYLKDISSKLGIIDKVEFIGWRDDLPMIFRQVDVFIQTCRYEGFGRLVAQSLASGIPVVNSSRGGPEEILANGIGGYIVESNPEQIAEKVIVLLKNRELRKKMGINGRKRVVENYSIPVYRKKMEDIFKIVLIS